MGVTECLVYCQVVSFSGFQTDFSDRADDAGSLDARKQRFDGIVGKVVERWNQTFNQFPGGIDLSVFIKLIGVDRVGDYIRTFA